MNIEQFRSTYPQYNDLSDSQLVDALHSKFYSDLDRTEVQSVLGVHDYNAGDFVTDSAVKLGQGAIELGQQVVGGADLVTGGIFGIREGLEKAAGYQPEQAKQILGNELSDTQQRQDAALSQAHGLDKFGAAIENPLAVTGAIEQSIPSMLAGMGLTKAVATKIFTEAATAAGGLETAEGIAAGKQAVQEAATKLIGVSSGAEGAITAGGIAEEADRNGKDWSEYAPEALGAGAVTGAIGFGSGKLFGDVATDLAAGTKTMNGGFLAKVGKGAFTEGLMEEAPQSSSETAFTNSIYDRPIGEGVADSAIEGGIIGGVMGAAMGGSEHFTQRNQPDGTSPLGEQILKDEAPVDSATMSETPSNNNGIDDHLGDLNARVQSILNPASVQNPIQQIAQTETIDDAIGAFNNSVVVPQLDAPVEQSTSPLAPIQRGESNIALDETAIEPPQTETKYPTKLDDSQESIALLDQFLSNGAILKGRFLIHDNKQVTALTKTQKDLAEELLKNESDIKTDFLPITEQTLNPIVSDNVPTGEIQSAETTSNTGFEPFQKTDSQQLAENETNQRNGNGQEITNTQQTSVENANLPKEESTRSLDAIPVSYDNLDGLLKRPSDNAPFKDEKSANTRFKLQKLSDEDYAVIPVQDGYAIAPIKAMDYQQFKVLPDNAPFSDDVVKQSFEALTGKVAPSTIPEKVVENSAEKLASSFPVEQQNNEGDLVDNSTPTTIAEKSTENSTENLSPSFPKDLSKINDISLPKNWKTDLPQAKWLAGRILRELEGKTGTDRQNAVESITDVNKITPFIEQVLNDANAQKIVKPESPYHPAIANYAIQLVKNGGVEILPDGSRTPSVNPDWFRSGKGKNTGKTFKAYKTVDKTGKVVDFYSGSVSVEEVKKAVSAHDAGQKLTARQHGILLALSDVAQAEEDFHNRNDVDFDDAEISALSSLLHEIEVGETSIFASMSESDFDKMLDNLDTKPKTERENMLALGFTEKEIEQELNNGDDTRGNRNTQGNVTREEKGSDQNVAGAKKEGTIESSPLSQYTNDEILAREKELAELDKQEKERDLKAKQKAEADRQIDTLADEMLGKGGTATKSLFDIVEPPKRKSAFDDSSSITDKGREAVKKPSKPAQQRLYSALKSGGFKERYDEDTPIGDLSINGVNYKNAVILKNSDANTNFTVGFTNKEGVSARRTMTPHELVAAAKEVGNSVFDSVMESAKSNKTSDDGNFHSIHAEIIDIFSNEFSENVSDRKKLKQEILDELRNRYQGNSKIVNAANGDEILITWNGLKHMMNAGLPTWQEALAALHIESLINRADFAEIRPDKLGRNDPKTTTLYQVEANFDGIRNVVTIFVHDHSDGKRYYDHVTIEKSPVGLTESDKKKSNSPTLPYAGDVENISQLDDDSTGNIRDSIHAEKNTPQRIHVSSQIKNLLTDFEKGNITQEQLTRELSKLHDKLESQKDDKALREAQKGRVRGADYIRQKLLEAKRRGDISDDAADLAEWFILQNEALVDDLGISLKGSNQSERKGSAGYYSPFNRLLTLIKGNVKDTTAVHEMLHHLERLMPEDLQAGIRSEWLKQTLVAYKKATDLHADYFEAALSGNQERALKILSKIGDKNQKLYRFINASEFWAVNSTDILQNRFHAKSSAIGRVKQWLREFIQHVKKTFGFASHSPLLNTLDYLLNQSNGDKQTNSMLSQRNGHLFADNNDDYASPNRNEKNIFDRTEQAIRDSWLGSKLNKLPRWFTAMGTLADRDDYLIERYKTLGRIDSVDRLVHEIFTTLRKASKDDAAAIYDYLITKDALPNEISNENLRMAAKNVKDVIVTIGEKMVERGLITQEVYEANKGAYLPRLYLKHILGNELYESIGTGKNLSDLGYLKKRKDIPEEVRRLWLMEIKNPAYLASRSISVTMRDLAVMNFFEQIANNEKWVWKQSLITIEVNDENAPTAIFDKDGNIDYKKTQKAGDKLGKSKRRVTPYFLAKEAERMRRQSIAAPTEDKADIRELADALEQAANNAIDEMAQEGTPKDFVQMPDSARYGALRGLVIRKEIYDDIVGVFSMTQGDKSTAEQWLGDMGVLAHLSGFFKTTHVVLNPPTQVVNFISNLSMIHLSGVAFHKVPVRMIQSFKEITSNGKHYQALVDMGGNKATFSNQELRRMNEYLIEAEAENAGEWTWHDIQLLAAKVLYQGNKVVTAAGNVHQFMEMWSKTAVVIDKMEKGMTAEKAVLAAHDALIDYSLVSRNVRYLRNNPLGAPFITFFVKSSEILLDTVINKPWKFVPYYTMLYMMQILVASMAGVDKDDVDKLSELLPKLMRDKGHAYILPFKDSRGDWQGMDFSKFLPWGTQAAMTNLVAHGEAIEALKQIGLLGTPIASIISAIKTNKDSFTDRPIVDKYGTPTEQIGDMLRYAYNTFTPPFLTLNDKNQIDLISKTIGELNKYGELKKTKGQALASLFGANVRSVTPLSREKELAQFDYEIADIKRNWSHEKKDQNLSDSDRREINQGYLKKIQVIQKEKSDYLKRTNINPKLMAR